MFNADRKCQSFCKDQEKEEISELSMKKKNSEQEKGKHWFSKDVGIYL